MTESALQLREPVYATWRVPLVLVVAAIIYVFLLYYPTSESIVSIWIRSDTFMHGFLIFPISIWLIWQRKDMFANIQPVPSIASPLLLVVVSLGWLVAYYVDVLLIQQLALIAMIPLLVLCLLGWNATKQIAFPLFFLIFAVPMGEGLVPYMIEITADFTVAMINLVGIPVYREGNYFELPSGNWSVVEACSGVRYLIASITLGCLYAYLTYTSLNRRIIFIVVSIFVPVLANGLRAFMIVMLGHYSDMKLATGVDHLIYGWLFFGIVIAMMFYIGSFWREERTDNANPLLLEPKGDNGAVIISGNHFYTAFVLCLLAVSIAPLKAYTESSIELDPHNLMIKAPVANDWEISAEQLTTWKPRFEGMDADLHQTYVSGLSKVSLYLGYYAEQRHGAELITSTNVLVDERDKTWRMVKDGTIVINPQGDAAYIVQSVLRSSQADLLVMYYFLVNGEIVINPFKAKLFEATAHLLGGDTSASIVSVATTIIDEDKESAQKLLINFINQMHQPISDSLNSVQEG